MKELELIKEITGHDFGVFRLRSGELKCMSKPYGFAKGLPLASDSPVAREATKFILGLAQEYYIRCK